MSEESEAAVAFKAREEAFKAELVAAGWSSTEAEISWNVHVALSYERVALACARQPSRDVKLAAEALDLAIPYNTRARGAALASKRRQDFSRYIDEHQP